MVSLFSSYLVHEMSVIKELQSQALSKNPLLYLHCLDYKISDKWKSSDLPCLEFQLVLGHVSFLENLFV